LIYQVLEEENLDQKSPGTPGWRLMQRASSLLIIKKQEMLKNQTPSLRIIIKKQEMLKNQTPSLRNHN
jgi:hypothetical protein